MTTREPCTTCRAAVQGSRAFSLLGSEITRGVVPRLVLARIFSSRTSRALGSLTTATDDCSWPRRHSARARAARPAGRRLAGALSRGGTVTQQRRLLGAARLALRVRDTHGFQGGYTRASYYISAASEALVRVAPIIPQRYTTVLSASLPLWAAICMLISRSRKPKYPYAPLRSSSLWIPVLADPANESKWQ